jgi:hypothetical protein
MNIRTASCRNRNMAVDPNRWQENALHRARRPTAVRTPERKMQLIQLVKRLIRRSTAPKRNMAWWTWTNRLRSRRVASPHTSDQTRLERLEEANRQVAQSERLVAGWGDVIDRMQAEDRDVTVARDLLETFRGDLEVHRRNATSSNG